MAVGRCIGAAVDGAGLGRYVGGREGSPGATVGIGAGTPVGAEIGTGVGAWSGTAVGEYVGDAVDGAGLGRYVGGRDGSPGTTVGIGAGTTVGAGNVVTAVGAGSGAAV